ncbi:MAG: RNA polymerase sigma factor SigF, partial [Actinobacteria bacterium]|nr:RNA polymerase sigma factor SigF [Actinomycetota bacterium]
MYLPVARRLAKRYAGVREPYDDLLQVASLGLLNA